MKTVAFRAFLITFLLFAVVPTGFPVRAGSREPVRIGEVNPLTGRLATHGREIHEGILLAVEEASRFGGLEGRPVELLTRDDQSRPDVAINQTQDLLYRQKVVALVGGYVDSLVGPISELAARHGTPYVASASLQRSLTLTGDNPYFFRVAHVSGLVEPICGFLSGVLRPRRLAVLYAATPGATELAGEVRACLSKQGIPLRMEEKFRPGTPDFSPLVLKMRRERVDVLLCAGFFSDHLILVRQLREQKVPLEAYVGPWGVAYDSFIEETGALSERLIGMCAWNPGIPYPGTEEASRRFVEAFRERFERLPTTTTMHGYTSAKVLLMAIDRVLEAGRELSGEAISASLRGLDETLPMGRVAFDEKGDPKFYRQVIVQVQDRRLVPVYPEERARGALLVPW